MAARRLPALIVATSADRAHGDRGVARLRRLRRLHRLPAVLSKLLTVPGCQAGTGDNAVALDFGQAADAATVAAVAVRDTCQARALTIAYATAFQESKLENLTYGDRDSVGIFQQRPSEGWGSAAQLQDPAYAAQAFFGALVKVPNYTTIPVYQAAQDVQHSADGYAYQQYAQTGALLAADYTAAPHAVTCWYNPARRPRARTSPRKLDLHGAAEELDRRVRHAGARRGADRVTRIRSGSADLITTAPERGLGRGELAGHQRELVRDHAGQLRGVPVDGGAGETSWQADPARRRGVLSPASEANHHTVW